jgi:hypothetical protein
MEEFIGYPKIPRLSRDIVITEKIDGTNAQIYIPDDLSDAFAASRKKWITPEKDNHGFAKWVLEHKDELIAGLGAGRHFGEWWGQGINRGYGLKEKRFSLFRVDKWGETRPSCCHIVPVIFQGEFTTDNIQIGIEMLRSYGSYAAPGYKNPEGIVIFHTASGYLFKKTLENDDKPKGAAE